MIHKLGFCWCGTAHVTLADIPVAGAIISEIAQRAPDARVSDVIRAISQRHPPAIVREVYWQLIADNLIVRHPDGRLSGGLMDDG